MDSTVVPTTISEDDERISLAGVSNNYGSTNAELDALAFDLIIPNYVRCRMKDELRGKTAAASECGIVNLQNTDQAGSHWVLYFKDPTRKIATAEGLAARSALCLHSENAVPPLTVAYSSYGDPVPQELVDYLGQTPPIGSSPQGVQESTPIFTSDIQIQDFAETSCGYYCIAILLFLAHEVAFEDIVLGLHSRAEEARRLRGASTALPL